MLTGREEALHFARGHPSLRRAPANPHPATNTRPAARRTRGELCAIFREPLREEPTQRWPSCMHQFHEECIRP
eukprot:5001237-Prorocentrum_lima.AAC.1